MGKAKPNLHQEHRRLMEKLEHIKEHNKVPSRQEMLNRKIAGVLLFTEKGVIRQEPAQPKQKTRRLNCPAGFHRMRS